MADTGLELCDAGFQAAQALEGQPRAVLPSEDSGVLGWMGLVHHDGQKYAFGGRAEDEWFVHPRQICRNVWLRLSREPSTLTVDGRAVSFSQLAFYFLKDYVARLPVKPTKVMLAVPGGYLKDEATEDEKVGLLLGMAAELGLPLAGIVDMACAALCDPRIDYFDPSHPILVVDVQMHGCELTMIRREDHYVRRGFAFLPQTGFQEVLQHLTTAMGNRFLRHTTFDILEDGRIEQVFYRQTKDFLLSGGAEQQFQINTANRAYQMVATRDQLVSDSAGVVQSVVQGAQALLESSGSRGMHCTVALTGRTVVLPGIAARLRSAGMGRLLRLPVGAAAAGAVVLGLKRELPADITETPVETSVPIALAQRVRRIDWEARLVKAKRRGGLGAPTHVIYDGLGHAIDGRAQFTIGAGHSRPDFPLPEDFDPAGDDCLVRIEQESGQLCFVEMQDGEPPMRSPIESGDRLMLRCGDAEIELLFACCPGTPLRR